MPSLPWPNTRSSSGAIATSGTERSNMAIGMNATSTGLHRTNATAITVAIAMPEKNPMAAFTSVVASAPKLATRAAAALSDVGRTPRAGASENRYCHTSSGDFPTNVETPNSFSNAVQSTASTTTATTIVSSDRAA